MSRTDTDSWDLASSVGATATMVAAARALVSREPDALIDDPFAAPLVRAVGLDFFTRLVDGDIPDADRLDFELCGLGRVRRNGHLGARGGRGWRGKRHRGLGGGRPVARALAAGESEPVNERHGRQSDEPAGGPQQAYFATVSVDAHTSLAPKHYGALG